jgi:hypothetical protein
MLDAFKSVHLLQEELHRPFFSSVQPPGLEVTPFFCGILSCKMTTARTTVDGQQRASWSMARVGEIG